MTPLPSPSPPLSHPAVLLATWFGAGLLKPAPGTWGSLAALAFAFPIHLYYGWQGLLLASVIVFVIGVWAAGVYVRLSGKEDASPIVIDEVAGMWLTLAFVFPLSLNPTDWKLWPICFLAFRAMDIIKPWPVSLADAKVKGGFGVMLDDILAALFAVGVALIAQDLLGWMI